MSPKKNKNDTIEAPLEMSASPSLESAASEWTTDPIAVGHVDDSILEDATTAGESVSHEMSLSEVSALLSGEEIATEESPEHTEESAEDLALDTSDSHSIAEELSLESGEDDVQAMTRETLSASVTFVADPFQLGESLEVAAAQRSDEELDLDEVILDDEESDDDFEDAPLELVSNDEELADTLSRLQEKMDAETASLEKDLAAAALFTKEGAEKHLAEQIAEDQALEKEMSAEEESENDSELRAALPREPEEDEYGNLDLAEIESCIESILFMSEKPVSAKKLHELLGPDMALEYFDEALVNLKARYQKRFHGFELLEIANGYQFRTKPARAALAKKLSKIQTQRLSTGAMESLAIIAYKQPVLKDDVDKIRGVDSSHFIRGLMDKKLIKIAGRSELPGRPMLYTTTTEFLEVFSLKSLESMPALKELESMIPGSQQGGSGFVDPRVQKMRDLVSEMNADDSVSLLYDPKEDEAFLSDIRERVKSIEIVTPTLQAQNDEADAAKQATKARNKAIQAGEIDPQAESFAAAVQSTDQGNTAEMPIE